MPRTHRRSVSMAQSPAILWFLQKHGFPSAEIGIRSLAQRLIGHYGEQSPPFDPAIIAKELKVLEIFQEVGESYAKARSLHIQFGKGSEMIPKNDLLSALADLGKAEQNTHEEIKDLSSTLESIYKQAEQLGEQKIA